LEASIVTFDEWCARYPDAYRDVVRIIVSDVTHVPAGFEVSEAGAQAAVRAEASQHGHRLFRNNVGAGTVLESGSFLRWGLANDSPAVNAKIKSADLIGWRALTITPDLVNARIARFLSREIKNPGWKYAGTDREKAQLKWAILVLAAGGDAAIVTGVGSL
jgi:hypothetical protein